MNQAEGFATAPQGNVTQASHKHVTKQNLPSRNATNTFHSGEAQRVLVVGGYGGLGAVICEQFAERGASVAIAGRSLDKATELAEKLAGNGATTLPLALDVTDSASIDAAVAAVVDAWGGLDVLVNSASTLVTVPAEHFDDDQWEGVVRANLVGAFLLSKSVGRYLLAHGGGRIIHLSSVRGDAGGRMGFSAYGASKAGVNLLVKQLATEWGGRGVTVNAVAPGFMRTDFVEAAQRNEQFVARLRQRIPIGRFAEPEEVASAVVYLATPLARFINGQVVYVDGGVTASH
ncbi:SDR family NAD(P)-dependent oxidoreductase [Actinophytocola sp.]|uniref:SDR family NAD(P)-dependent oxidoreductase n=1 Tax=Actinophytocola sp. TaxID=1872138 RepID=UPI003D6B36B8